MTTLTEQQYEIIQLRRILEDLRAYISWEDLMDLTQLSQQEFDDLKARKDWFDTYIANRIKWLERYTVIMEQP